MTSCARPWRAEPNVWSRTKRLDLRACIDTESRRLAMTTNSSSPTRRQILATTASAGALGLELSGILGEALAKDAAPSNAILPFRVHVPDADLADLKRRLAATRWPDKE